MSRTLGSKNKPKPVDNGPKEEGTKAWVLIVIIFGIILAVVALYRWLNPSMADAKPEPACKVENAECDINKSDKLCCEGLVCMDKGVPSSNGKCKLAPTPTMTPIPTPTPPACQTWTCGECEEYGTEETIRIVPACMGEKKYCEETYDCKMVCPTEDKCDKEEKVWKCDCPPEPTVTPEPTQAPTPEPTKEPTREQSKPEGCTENCHPAACTDQTPQPVVNPHVYRNGDCAIVKYWPTSDKVNIYWKDNSSSDWQHSLANQSATGSHEICGLSGDVTFGVQSVSGCAADGIANASTISSIVDGACSEWILFR